MRTNVKTAKNEGLNWQTLVIEDAQTEIKTAIRDAVLVDERKSVTVRKLEKIIEQAANDVEIPELKEKTENILKRYAQEQYIAAKKRLAFTTAVVVGAVLGYNNAETAKTAKRAENKLIKVVPYIEHGLPLQEYAETYMRRVRDTFKALAESEAKEYDSPVSLRNIAEMTVREQRHRDELAQMREKGVNLVWTSTHSNCSERCQPWQGKLYSLDGTYGMIDGIKYQPLENGTDIFSTTRKGRTYKNGIISGFNCRHYLIPYKRGSRPIHVNAETINRQREIDKQQRYLERRVRKYRDLAQVYKGVDKRLYTRYLHKAREWNARYISYSKENRVAYYPSRTEIFD